jgi:phospholipid/cholesterol/gamma-HCH transport system substrate-binding protein
MRSPEGFRKRQLSVGAFLVLGIAVFFTFSLKMTDSPLFRRGSKVTVYLADATGVFVNSKVKLSGIDVGVVDKIELDQGKAKISLTIDKGVELPDPAIVVPKPMGVLGDKYLDIQRATADDLEKQQEAKENPEPQSSLWRRAFETLDRAIFTPAYAEAPRREYKSGEVLPARDQSAALDDLMRDMAKLSEDLKVITKEVRSLVGDNRQKIDNTINNFNKITNDIAQLSGKINDPDVKKEIEKLSESVVQLGNTIRNLESISQKIQNGEGTIGKLINDSETIDRVNDTLGAVNATIDRARRIQTWVDVETLYLGQSSEVQTRVNLGLFTSYDFSYWAGFTLDDYGTYEKIVTTDTEAGQPPTTHTEEIRKPNSLKYTFMLYKKFPSFAAAAGMIESSGGFHLELFNRRETLRATLTAYDFASESNPILRFNVLYNPWSVFTISAGYFHALEKSGLPDSRRSWSVGIGLRFSDEDLKTVLLIPGVS